MAPREPVEHKVTIFCHAGQAKVWPPYLILRAGDNITFSTINTAATITFPNYHVFNAPPEVLERPQSGPGTEGTLRLAKDTEVSLATVGTGDAGAGFVPDDEIRHLFKTDKNTQMYAYSIFCKAVNDYAQGNSSPVMILEPPEPRPGP